MQEYIDEFAENGKVMVEVWQMDCDCSSWTVFRECDATQEALEALEDEVYQNAEGPVRFSLIKPSECPDRPPEGRDHALEAFENGHPHTVYI